MLPVVRPPSVHERDAIVFITPVDQIFRYRRIGCRHDGIMTPYCHHAGRHGCRASRLATAGYPREHEARAVWRDEGRLHNSVAANARRQVGDPNPENDRRGGGRRFGLRCGPTADRVGAISWAQFLNSSGNREEACEAMKSSTQQASPSRATWAVGRRLAALHV